MTGRDTRDEKWIVKKNLLRYNERRSIGIFLVDV